MSQLINNEYPDVQPSGVVGIKIFGQKFSFVAVGKGSKRRIEDGLARLSQTQDDTTSAWIIGFNQQV